MWRGFRRLRLASFRPHDVCGHASIVAAASVLMAHQDTAGVVHEA